jgi:hypothetical protein
LNKILDPVFAKVALRESLRDALGFRHSLHPLPDHLAAAMQWLARAQDQANNGGVSAGFGRTGWRPDYPETTGYIIPTFLDYHRLTGDGVFLERAKRMGDYELKVQLTDGAIPGGFAEPRKPCVFDTGQVIFGWLALSQATSERKYLAAAQAAGDWLLAIQSPDGAWHQFDHADSGRAYHARVSWALVMLGQATGRSRYADAAKRQLDWTCTNQKPNGWFANAELRGKPGPVTHTIAYTIRGLLESGAALQEQKYIDAARCAADALRDIQLDNGALYGMFDGDWMPMVKWYCLTGCAQMAINWFRLYELTGDAPYVRAAQKSNAFVRQTQDLKTKDPARGAIKGSLPFHGAYERFTYPNWATKFFADALMLEQRLATKENIR